MANKNLSAAKNAKQDEFYTQYEDIQKEVNAYLERDENTFRGKTVLLPCDDPEWSNFTRFFAQNFEMLGLKKLISTSYALDSKRKKYGDPFGYAQENGAADDDAKSHGKIFVLDHDTNESGRIDIEDLEWHYLKGDGDFRSDEVKALRDEADIIVTNPPFSLLREFFAWIIEGKKSFLMLGNKNAVTYKEVFPLIKNNILWAGVTNWAREVYFDVPESYKKAALAAGKDRTIVLVNGKYMARSNSVWYTNLDHGRRHQPLELMTEAENIKHSKHKEVRGIGYQKYDNYDAIEVPFTDAIPDDYEGVMGVPISFLDKYCPEQFEMVGVANHGKDSVYDLFEPSINGKTIFKRILIRHKKGTKK